MKIEAQPSGKKITRGIDLELSDAFKKSELYKLYQNHKDELIIGIRNNYLNLYYNCDSIAKINYLKKAKEISSEISTYYLGRKEGDKSRCKVEPSQIGELYNEIKKWSYMRSTNEKKAQSKLVLQNNLNEKSNWYCIDVEYIKQFNNKDEKKDAKFNARFDIIALSITKPHRVALIELKYGNGAIGGDSGIFKHVKDFSKFQEKGYFESHLQYEITEIVRSLIDLDIPVPFETPEKADLLTPEFFFITLDNNAKENASTPKQSMAGYLFNEKRWGCKRLSTKGSVQDKFGDITRKDNKFFATFLFSKQKLDALVINDILDIKQYDDKVIPL